MNTDVRLLLIHYAIPYYALALVYNYSYTLKHARTHTHTHVRTHTRTHVGVFSTVRDYVHVHMQQRTGL